ncbi:phage tail tape measure protein [Solicola sp. PLA-1-18]|uniref:phage tail tape measure protein n=1 Tax=Solicola sp. PLA-1-18 TaxID=3380532 RepID=UPI003B7E9AB0
MANRSVLVRLIVDPKGAIQGFQKSALAAKDFNAELAKSEKKRRAMQDIGDAAGVMGVGFGVAVTASVVAAARFDKAMSSVDAATHETAANMELLRAAAIKAGADTSFSATEAAAGIEELAKAGVSTRDILAGGLTGALDLAAAGSIGVAEAAEITASTMNQFNLSGADTVHIADLLAATAGKAQGGVTDMGNAFKYVGPVAAQMGVSIEETAGAVGLLASNGILGDQAGTSLRGMLSSLTSPSQLASDTMKSLGINVYDAAGQFVGFEGVAGQLKSQMGDLTNAERDQALGRLFGNEQITAARILYDGGAQAVAKWTKNVDEQGYAADTASRKMDNLSGDLERLKGSLETAFIGTGSGAQGPLRSLAQTGDQLVDTYNQLPGPLKSTALGLAGVTAAVGGATFVTTRAVSGYHSMNDTLQTLGLRSEKTGEQVQGFNKRAIAMRGGALAIGAGLTVVSGSAGEANRGLGILTSTAGSAAMGFSVAGPWGAAVGGGIGLLTSFAKSNTDAAVGVEGLTATLDRQTGALTENSGAFVADDLRKTGALKNAVALGINLDTLTQAAMGNKDAMNAVSAAIASVDQTAQGYSGEGSEVQLTKEQQAAENLASALGKTRGNIRANQKEWQENKTVTDAVTGSQKSVKGAVGGTTTAVDQQAAAVADLKKAQDDLKSGNLSTYESQTRLKQAYRDAAAAAKENRNGIKNGGDSAIKARESIASLASAWNDASDEAQDKPGAYKRARRNFIDLAEAMTGSRKQARALADKLLEIPKKRTTTVVTKTEQASKTVNDFTAETRRKLNDIGPFNVDITLSAKAQKLRAEANRTRGKDVPTFATGGEVPLWAGEANRDSVPAMLMPGEHVLTTADVKSLGGQAEVYRLRQAIQSGEFKKGGDLGFPGKGKSIPHFAEGGAVGTINVDTAGLGAAVSSVTADFNGMAQDISAELSRVASQLFALLGSGIGGLSPLQIQRGQAFAQSQVGKPYVWGGVGPGGYDCSGFVSAVLNAALGQNPYSRRGATGSMPWAGFRSGGGGAFDVGWFTGSPGHTAARIGNMNVESYGGHGPAVGKGARGPDDSLFNRRMSYAGKRDSGGFVNNDTFVVNTSGRREYMLDPRQTQHFAAGGAVTKSENLTMPRSSSAGSIGSLTFALQANTAAVARNTTAALSPAAALSAANRRKSQFDASVTTLENAQSAVSDATSNRASRLDILNQQKSVRDLQKSLASKKKGERLKGLDRQIARAELGEAQKELARMNASRAALDKARAALAVAQKNRARYGSIAAEEARVAAAEAAVEAAQGRSEAVAASASAVTDQAGIGDLGSASAVNRNLRQTLMNLGQFTSVMAALKARGASPWLLNQLNEAGPTKTAIRIGQQYLQNAPALNELNRNTALLSQAGRAYGQMTNDPRWQQAGGYQPAGVSNTLKVEIEHMTDDRFAAEVDRRVKFTLNSMLAGAMP